MHSAPPPLYRERNSITPCSIWTAVCSGAFAAASSGLPFAVRPFEHEGDGPEDVDTMVEPDIAVVCDPSKLDDIGCKGTPNLVM